MKNTRLIVAMPFVALILIGMLYASCTSRSGHRNDMLNKHTMAIDTVSVCPCIVCTDLRCDQFTAQQLMDDERRYDRFLRTSELEVLFTMTWNNNMGPGIDHQLDYIHIDSIQSHADYLQLIYTEVVGPTEVLIERQ